MDSVVLAGVAVQSALAVVALLVSASSLRTSLRAKRELATKLQAEAVASEDVNKLLAALSAAESVSEDAMKQVLRDERYKIAVSISELDHAARRAVQRVLTQPSDLARRKFLVEAAA